MKSTPPKRAPAIYRKRLTERGVAPRDSAVAGGEPVRGGILSALRRSPLVGADLDLSRTVADPREVDLAS